MMFFNEFTSESLLAFVESCSWWGVQRFKCSRSGETGVNSLGPYICLGTSHADGLYRTFATSTRSEAEEHGRNTVQPVDSKHLRCHIDQHPSEVSATHEGKTTP